MGVSLAGYQAQSTPVQLVVGESAEVRLTLQGARAAVAPPVAASAPTPGDLELAPSTKPNPSPADEAQPAWH